ncbi:MAG TPA: universal stress protein [Blastocatellia bacterium]|nr:universal stress protein [Blastocatellia bacterium]
MKILVAVDGSSFSDATVNEVARRPWPAGSEVRIISVIEPPLIPTVETWALPDNYYDEMEKAAEDQARGIVGKAADRFHAEQPALPVATELIRGYPKHAILDEAESWGADLIVVGSHGYSGFTRLLLGSVSQAVASHAKCSVEIVRGRTGA